jgi:DNA modification methylase
MPELPDESIQMVVTSPPYWGLRKYTGQQDLIWDGDKDCQHEWGKSIIKNMTGGTAKSTLGEKSGGHAISDEAQLRSIERSKYSASQGNFCSLCGAWRGSYGLEPTPELYVHHSVEILREIKRVLRKDGVVFWNIGDSYAGSWGAMSQDINNKEQRAGFVERPPTSFIKSKRLKDDKGRWGGGNNPASGVLKPKDLCLIPFRVAIAAQEDGWWVRSDIIWSKNNPMPESVRDRPTNSHEYIFMLTKNADYYWDMEAVRENLTQSSLNRLSQNIENQNGSDRIPGKISGPMKACASDWHGSKFQDGKNKLLHPECQEVDRDERPGRNMRSVWEFPTQGYKDAHFATFPETLPERCIKAATSEAGCCSKCGKPWERIVERKGGSIGKGSWVDHNLDESAGKSRSTGAPHGGAIKDYQTKTIGWEPSCKCSAPPQPSLVLDPFAGSGTTLFVAARMGRNSVGYELSEEYCRLIVNRNRQHVLV